LRSIRQQNKKRTRTLQNQTGHIELNPSTHPLPPHLSTLYQILTTITPTTYYSDAPPSIFKSPTSSTKRHVKEHPPSPHRIVNLSSLLPSTTDTNTQTDSPSPLQARQGTRFVLFSFTCCPHHCCRTSSSSNSRSGNTRSSSTQQRVHPPLPTSTIQYRRPVLATPTPSPSSEPTSPSTSQKFKWKQSIYNH
jgi:hypothetical protein